MPRSRNLKVLQKNSSPVSSEDFYNSDFLKNLIDTSPNLIFVKDKEGRFVLVNKAVANLYGTTVENLVGKTDADFNPQNEEVEWYQKDDSAVIDGNTTLNIPEEKVTDSQGEEHWFKTIKKPISSPSGETYVLGVATEITESKLLYEQLMYSQKMEAIGKLAGGIAHDFNNLMTVILGYLSVIEEVKDPAVKNAVHGIEQASQKATELTAKLLGFAKGGKHRNEIIDVHELIQETVSLLERTFEDSIDVKYNFNADNCCIKGDPIQMQQVVLNLAINARDAMLPETGGTQGGELVINTSNSICLNSENSLDYRNLINIEVSDTGIGIKPDKIQKIFDPFFTTKKASYGTGLGLSMVFGIVSNHSGKIDVKSLHNSGTIFTLSFPICKNTSSFLKKEKQQKIYVENNNTFNILLVDDNSYLLDSSSLLLTSLGHEVFTANTRESAISIFKENPHIDLVILDLVMHGMSVEEAINEFKLSNPKIKIIISTGYDANLKVDTFLNQGISAYIQKPYRKKDLSEILSKVSDSG